MKKLLILFLCLYSTLNAYNQKFTNRTRIPLDIRIYFGQNISGGFRELTNILPNETRELPETSKTNIFGIHVRPVMQGAQFRPFSIKKMLKGKSYHFVIKSVDRTGLPMFSLFIVNDKKQELCIGYN